MDYVLLTDDEEAKDSLPIDLPSKPRAVSVALTQLGETERAYLGEGIVPLSDLYANLRANARLIDALVARADEGLRQALLATLETLSSVFEYTTPGWDELKQKVEVSFVKSTSSTNTSVTSGVAMRILQPGQSIGILNCGTGPLKFQFYTMDRARVVRVLHDETPAQISLSSLAVPPLYQPKRELSAKAISAALHMLLVPLRQKFQTRIVAIVTGKLRGAWERAAEGDQVDFVEKIKQVFEPLEVTPWDTVSYFVTQDEEGVLEHRATSNLIEDINPEYDLMISLGIGKGACQWATPYTTIKHDSGMGDPTTLIGPAGLRTTVMRGFSSPQYIRGLLEFAKNFPRPVLALKSGCLIWLTKDTRLFNIIVQGRSRKQPRGYGPEFQRDQSLRFLMDSSVIDGKVVDFESNRHSVVRVNGGPRPANQPFSIDLRSTLFVAEASSELNFCLESYSRDVNKYHIMNTQLYELEDLANLNRETEAILSEVDEDALNQELLELERELEEARVTEDMNEGKSVSEVDESILAGLESAATPDPPLEEGVSEEEKKTFNNPTTLESILVLRKEHFAQKMESGFYVLRPQSARIVRAMLDGKQVYRYHIPKLMKVCLRERRVRVKDMDGHAVGWVKFQNGAKTASFSEMNITFSSKFKPQFLRHRTFQFCSKRPILIDLFTVPCYSLGSRLVVPGQGICTLVRIEEGEYFWRFDNKSEEMEDIIGWPAALHQQPRHATRFCYQPNVKLLVLTENKPELWVLATVRQSLFGNRHELELSGGQVVRMDLNDFNHTWREPLVDDSGGFEACMSAYNASVEAASRMVEDAITGRKLRVADQLLTIEMTSLSDANYSIPRLENVESLAQFLLRASRAQNRQLGLHRTPPFIIVAKPGSGKTWTIKQLVYLLSVCPCPPQAISFAPLVIYVQVLASFIRKHDPLLQECQVSFVEFYIRRTCDKPARYQFLLQAYRMRTLIIIVDGIDEASDLRRELVRWLVLQLHDQGHTFVATSRPEGVELQAADMEVETKGNKGKNDKPAETGKKQQYPDLEKFVKLDLNPLSTKQQDRAIQTQLNGNEFYNRLTTFSEIRLKHDELYNTFPANTQRLVEHVPAIDKFLLPDGTLDSKMRQCGTDGQLLRMSTPSDGLKSQYCRAPQSASSKKALLALSQKTGIAPDRLWEQVLGTTDDLYSVAEKVLPFIKQGMEKMCEDAKIPPESLEFGSLKDPVRVYEKSQDDYGTRFPRDLVPSTACVTDIIRCRILAPDLRSMCLLIMIFYRKPPPWLRLIRVKNKFKQLDSAHFRNLLLNFRAVCCGLCGALAEGSSSEVLEPPCGCNMPTSHLFEAQIHHKQIIQLNEELHAHDYYEFFRAINNVEVGEQLDFVIDKQLELFSEIRSSPILLSMLIIVLDRGDHRLPSTIYELYHLAIECSLSNFLRLRPQLDDAGSFGKDVSRVVQKIAYRNQIEKKRAFEHLPPTDPDFRIWNEICATGLNEVTVLSFIKVITQMELYQFTHLSFQELFFLEEAKSKGTALQFHTLIEDPWYFNTLRIASSCPNLNQLVCPGNTFRLQNQVLSPVQVDITYQMLKNSATLTTIALPGNKLSSLPNFGPKATVLDLSRNELKFPSPVIPELSHSSLTWLDLSNNALEDQDISNLVAALSENATLQILNLTGNSTQSLTALGSLHASNSELVSLGFSAPVDSIPAFAAALQSPTSLTLLILEEGLVELWPHDMETLYFSSRNQLPASVCHVLDALIDSEAIVADTNLICVAPIASLRAFSSAESSLRVMSLALQENGFVTCCISPTEPNLDMAGIRIGAHSIHQILRLSKSMKTLRVSAADTIALECLLQMLINHPFGPDRIQLFVTPPVQSETWSLIASENRLLLRALKFWGADIGDTSNQNSFTYFNKSLRDWFLLALMIPFVVVSIIIPAWTSLLGHAFLNKYRLVGAHPLSDKPFNPYHLITFCWMWGIPLALDLVELDPANRVIVLCCYGSLLVLTLFHLMKPNAFLPRDRRLSVWLMNANSITINIVSLFVHFITTIQLLTLLLPQKYYPDVGQSQLFPILLVDLSGIYDHFATHWLHVSLAMTVVAFGTLLLSLDLSLRPPFALVMFWGMLEVPIVLHLLDNSFYFLKPNLPHSPNTLTLTLAGLFLVAAASVMVYFKRDYTGRLLLDFQSCYAVWDLVVKFVVIFLWHLIGEAFPRVFLSVSLCIFFGDLILVSCLRPCTRSRGNLVKSCSSLWLIFGATCSLTAEASDDPSNSFLPLQIFCFGTIALSAVTAACGFMFGPNRRPPMTMDSDVDGFYQVWRSRAEQDHWFELIAVSFVSLFVWPPLCAAVFSGWSLNDSCFGLQVWLVVVVVGGVLAFIAGVRFKDSKWAKSQEKISVAFVATLLVLSFCPGVVLLALQDCGGVIFGFSVYAAVLLGLLNVLFGVALVLYFRSAEEGT